MSSMLKESVFSLDFTEAVANDPRFVPMQLQRFSRPHFLWINARATHDPQMLGGNQFSLDLAELLNSLGFVAGSTTGRVDCVNFPPESSLLANVDRYGGTLIGRNGGSARAGYVGNFHVKGIGLTALASVHWMDARYDGLLPLEEAVRETIYSRHAWEILPDGVIEPVVVGADELLLKLHVQHGALLAEAPVLLARPKFWRLAHFERALSHCTDRVSDFAVDADRVEKYWRELIGTLGLEATKVVFERLFLRWADSAARFFIECFDPGPYITSNVDLHGRLFDFGSATTMPSWERVHIGYRERTLAGRLREVVFELRRVTHYFIAHASSERRVISLWSKALESKLSQTFRSALIDQFLVQLSFSTGEVKLLTDPTLRSKILARLLQELDRLQARSVDAVKLGASLRWSISPFGPDCRSVGDLQSILLGIFDGVVGTESLESGAERLHFVHRARQSLYRPNLRLHISQKLNESTSSDFDELSTVIEACFPSRPCFV